MAGGSTTKVSPWEEQQPFLERGFQRAEQLYQQQPRGTPTMAGLRLPVSIRLKRPHRVQR